MRFLLLSVSLTFTAIVIYSCSRSEVEQGESLARKYCRTCHIFPEPSLLDKNTWANGVMPKMAFYMGMDYAPMIDLHPSERAVVTATIPDSPMLSEKDWTMIKQYYAMTAPDTLNSSVHSQFDGLTQFEASVWQQPGVSIPQLTLAQYQKGKEQFWIADRSANVHFFSKSLNPIDSIRIGSPAVAIQHYNDSALILKVGIMDPNDQAKGSLVSYNYKNKKTQTILDSLRRPVYFEIGDFNNDSLVDYIVCEFGNYTGGLTIFENLGNSKFRRHSISKFPGARKTIVRDFNNDGLLDVMALITQGNEQLTLYLNAGNFNFRSTALLRFPPVYGSSYFELADFNGDGKDDIIYSNGDNADYSAILKPYHGIRIYENKGFNQYQETFFFPLHGASQTISNDFDGDGDIDVAASSFFPDLKKHPQLGFVYLKNIGNYKFKPSVSELGASGRWMTMSSSDIDNDNDIDIVLAALNFDKGVTQELGLKWEAKPISLLILRNTGIKK